MDYQRDACFTLNSWIFSIGSFACNCVSNVYRGVEWRPFIHEGHTYSVACWTQNTVKKSTLCNVLRSQKGGANSKARTYLKMALFQAFTVTSLMLQSFWWKIGQKSHFPSKDQPKISPSFKRITSLWHSLQQKYCPAKRKNVNTAYVEQH